MDGEVSSSNFSDTAAGMSGDTVLTKTVDELSRVSVSGLIDMKKNRNKKLVMSKKAGLNKQQTRNSGTLHKQGLFCNLQSNR